MGCNWCFTIARSRKLVAVFSAAPYWRIPIATAFSRRRTQKGMFKISTGNLKHSLVTLTDYDLDMALDQQSTMEFEPQSPYSTSSTETAPLQCEELTAIKVYIRRLQIICSERKNRLPAQTGPWQQRS
ncbi:hypothetical protein TNCV_758951 [Trichonephila clavipes]|nr:hypothetical protein TNCV_758951 [Trichonephila clavipes]